MGSVRDVCLLSSVPVGVWTVASLSTVLACVCETLGSLRRDGVAAVGAGLRAVLFLTVSPSLTMHVGSVLCVCVCVWCTQA